MSTEQFAALETKQGESYQLRDDFGGDPLGLSRGSQVLLRLLHLTDLHVMDAGSPARLDWVEARSNDLKWHPLLHMARPHDTLATWGTAAFMRAIAENGHEFADLAIVTGDNIDNSQRNELNAYLALFDGGSFGFKYEGPQRASWATNDHVFTHEGDGLWPFWIPEPSDVVDRWTALRGFPKLPALLDATSSLAHCEGINMDWLGVLGNHDVMRQGTVFTTPAIETVATGAWRALGAPTGFDPDDPKRAYLENPGIFTEGQPRFQVSQVASRRSIDKAEFIRAHIDSGNHGFSEIGSGDYITDTEHVRIIVLETNHPTGHYQGSVGQAQLDWLDQRLVEAKDRPVVVASHHGAVSLDNTYGNADPTDRRLGVELETVLLRYGNVVAWLVGHRHVHRIRPVQNPHDGLPGFWEITTSSVIDWPCQIRSVEIVKATDGSIGIRTEVLDHDDLGTHHERLDETGLAAWHREVAYNADRADGQRHRDGHPTDRNVFLARPHIR